MWVVKLDLRPARIMKTRKPDHRIIWWKKATFPRQGSVIVTSGVGSGRQRAEYGATLSTLGVEFTLYKTAVHSGGQSCTVLHSVYSLGECSVLHYTTTVHWVWCFLSFSGLLFNFDFENVLCINHLHHLASNQLNFLRCLPAVFNVFKLLFPNIMWKF